MHPLIQLKTTRPLLITLALLCFGLLPKAQAVVPAPDGGYPGGNTAEGQNALFGLTSGGYNTAVGYFSLSSNTTNSFNTAIGAGTLLANTAGDRNTATGAGALLSNSAGASNTANGAFALFSNTEAVRNTATGDSALYHNTTGEANTAIGGSALFSNTTGSFNTAVGAESGSLIFTANGVIAINHTGADVSNSTWIANIYQTPTVSDTTLPVIVSEQGQLGTTPSSRRFKKEIKPMNQSSEAILALKPVTFHYKSDKTSTPQFGLVAEEVAEVNPDLVVRDKNGEIYSVRYDAVNAMLLNEFLKEHQKVEEQDRKLERQEASMAKQQKQIEALTAGLEKVSAQIEAIKPAPQVVKIP
ncbi:MAG: tail fiber domain-containing protein [Candidatus Udaeobacter sp.]